jgi:3'-phosphoadenosine 5'-phosphosulfate sulfotransferase (PAPS reductase)/FAD synthetase
MAGPLIDWSDDDVRDGIRQSATHVSYFYADYMRELERRAAERKARASSA